MLHVANGTTFNFCQTISNCLSTLFLKECEKGEAFWIFISIFSKNLIFGNSKITYSVERYLEVRGNLCEVLKTAEFMWL